MRNHSHENDFDLHENETACRTRKWSILFIELVTYSQIVQSCVKLYLFVIRDEYVDVYIDYYLNKSVQKQFEAFSIGFHRVCGGKVLVSVHGTIN